MRQRNFDQIYIYQPKMSQIQLIIKKGWPKKYLCVSSLRGLFIEEGTYNKIKYNLCFILICFMTNPLQ